MVSVLPLSPTIAVASNRGDYPRLEGRYRLDAVLGMNAAAVAENGGARVYVLDGLRAAVTNGALVKARVSWVLARSTLEVRSEALVRAADGAYVWQYCEGGGAAYWRNNTLVVPSEVRARARAGVFTKSTLQTAPCSVTVSAGAYELDAADSEIKLRRRVGAAVFGYLLVRDEGTFDVEQEAKQLAGFEG